MSDVYHKQYPDTTGFWLSLDAELRAKVRREPVYGNKALQDKTCVKKEETRTVLGFPEKFVRTISPDAPPKKPKPKKSKRNKIPPLVIPAHWTKDQAEKRLKRLLLIFNRTCFYCGGVYPANHFNRDHLWPSSKLDHRGDYNHLTNLVLSCLRCNTIKGDRLPTEDETIRAMNIFWLHDCP